MSGVASCKNEMGFGAYGPENGINNTATMAPVPDEEEGGTASTVAATTTELNFVNIGESTEPAADSMTGDNVGTTTVSPQKDEIVPKNTTSTELQVPLPPIEGPYTDKNVRIILYGIDLLDTAALNRWTTVTANYFEEFFNGYFDDKDDVIRSNITDMSIELSNVNQAVPPEHKFNPLIEANRKRNLRQTRRIQADIEAKNTQTMISFDQTSSFRSYLNVLNDEPQLIIRRPLETSEYRAEYVTYLRSIDFDTYGNLTFVSHILYTDFPTAAPSLSPTPEPSVSPVEPGKPTIPVTKAPVTDEPTFQTSTDVVCNLCKPGQYGVNADIIWNGEVSSCVDICKSVHTVRLFPYSS